jgi:SAM-dependent methyltransferase
VSVASNRARSTCCVVCTASIPEPLYEYRGPISISSTASIIAAPTIIYACIVCSHIQTAALDDLAHYYADGYNVHLASEAADDLYDVRDGMPIFRAQHQAAVVLERLSLPAGARVLDFGCGKAMSLRALTQERSDLRPAVFDVSHVYREAWDTFVSRDNQAVGKIPLDWSQRFDAVLSFFSLEHTTDPIGFLQRIRDVLRDDGMLHLAVPNVRRNPADFLVVDHVNHFSPASLRFALACAGFADVEIDEHVHESALIVTARRSSSTEFYTLPEASVSEFYGDALRIASSWSGVGEKLLTFEASRPAASRAAVYGSGFYGIFLASRLRDVRSVAYFLDRNIHQQSRTVLNLPVIAPENIGSDIDTVYVGLNPLRAREIIEGVTPLHARERTFFFLQS